VKSGGASASGRQWKTESRSNHVVDAGEVGAIEEVESFRHQLQASPFAKLELAGQAHVKVRVVRSKPGIAACADGAVIGGMAVAVDVGASEQIKRMPAVKTNNGRKLEAREGGAFPRAMDDRRRDNLVPLIKVGEPSFGRQISVVLRPKVTVEICRSVQCFAIGVVANECEVVAELLFEFDDSTLVKRGSLRRILIRLKNRRISGR